jgi:hypothetical protein
MQVPPTSGLSRKKAGTKEDDEDEEGYECDGDQEESFLKSD